MRKHQSEQSMTILEFSNFQTKQLRSDMRELSKNAGWYDYFEQVNILGDDQPYEDVLSRLVKFE